MVKKIVVLAIFVPLLVNAQLLTSRFTTSFYGWQGRDSARAKVFYGRAYEHVQLNIANDKYQFLTNFQVANNFGTKLANDPELRISSLMVIGNQVGGLADISVGRQFVYAGVGAGTIDGGLVSAKFFDEKLGVTAYGGTNVIRTRDWNLNQSLAENSLYGGLVTYSPIENGSLGISYMNKLWKREKFSVTRIDPDEHPQTIVLLSNPNEEQYVSADVTYEVASLLNVYARSDYDLLRTGLSRTQFSTKYFINNDLSISADYLFRQPRVAYNSIFSIFNTSSTKELEGAIEYQLMPKARVYARFANVQYVDENSKRIAIGGMYDFLTFNYTQNFGYAGELNGLSVYASYPMMERMITPTLGFGFATYKLSSTDPRNSVMNVLVGCGYRPMKTLVTDVQFQWMKNPQYNSDARIFVKVSYFFSDKLNVF